MNKVLIISIAAAVLLASVIAAAITSEREETGSVFITGGGPVVEDQIRQKLTSDGWSDIKIARQGRYFHALASKGQQAQHFEIDSQTGRLRGEDDDD